MIVVLLDRKKRRRESRYCSFSVFNVVMILTGFYRRGGEGGKSNSEASAGMTDDAY